MRSVGEKTSWPALFFFILVYWVWSGNTTRKATTSKSLIPANSPFMAWCRRA